MRRTAPVADSVANAILALVPEPSVELDEDALLVIGDVVHAHRADRHGRLATTAGQAVGAFDVAEEPHLHGALGAARHVGQQVLQQAPVRVSRAPGEQRAQGRLRGQPALERTTE